MGGRIPARCQRSWPNSCFSPDWCVMCKFQLNGQNVNHMCSVKLLLLFGSREDGVIWESWARSSTKFCQNNFVFNRWKKAKVLWGCSVSGCSGEKKQKNI